jgi:hypothetical protein
MNASTAFWSPEAWTVFGGLFTFSLLLLSVYVTFSGCAENISQLKLVLETWQADLPLGDLEVSMRDVGAMTMALNQHGAPTAGTLCDCLRELRTDLQALAAATREAYGDDTESMTGSQPLATSVLLEILAELRQLKGDLKIQRKLPPFSLTNSFQRAPAEGLASEQIQTTP